MNWTTLNQIRLNRIRVRVLIGDRWSTKNKRRDVLKRLKCGMRGNFIRTSVSALRPRSLRLPIYFFCWNRNQIKFGALHISASIKSPNFPPPLPTPTAGLPLPLHRPLTPLSTTVKAIATSKGPLLLFSASNSFNLIPTSSSESWDCDWHSIKRLPSLGSGWFRSSVAASSDVWPRVPNFNVFVVALIHDQPLGEAPWWRGRNLRICSLLGCRLVVTYITSCSRLMDDEIFTTFSFLY